MLRDTPLFSGFDDTELNDAAKLASREDIEAGEMLVEQGRYGDACYVISEGTAAVYIMGEHRVRPHQDAFFVYTTPGTMYSR